MEYLAQRKAKLEELKTKAESNFELQRKLSRTFFLSSLLGGFVFFRALLGKSYTMTIPKLLIFGYGVSPIMKGSGVLGLLGYICIQEY